MRILCAPLFRLAVCAVFFLMIWRHEAGADPTNFQHWTSVASGCSHTTNVGSYATGGGSVTTSNGGSVTLFCPVQHTRPAVCTTPALSVTEKSSSTDFGGVYVFLIKVNLLTGAETTIANAAGQPVRFLTYGGSFFELSEPLDFEHHAYYVQVQLIGNTLGHPTQQTVYDVNLGCILF
jgi:hypothetical protein